MWKHIVVKGKLEFKKKNLIKIRTGYIYIQYVKSTSIRSKLTFCKITKLINFEEKSGMRT